MRKTTTVALAALAVLASTAATSAQEVLAQEVLGAATATTTEGVVIGATSPLPVERVIIGSPVPWVPGQVLPGASPTLPSGPIHPYSYYVEFPNPARTYVPYGPTDVFSFQGQAYGHAYDRWTWSAMSNASPGLGRYYQILH